MKKSVEKLIEELKGMVLDLHRSAGQLDSIVQQIELEIDNNHNEEYLKMFIVAQANYRADYKNAAFKDLDKKEELILKKLRSIISTKEES